MFECSLDNEDASFPEKTKGHMHTFPQCAYEKNKKKTSVTQMAMPDPSQVPYAPAKQRHSQLGEHGFVLCCAEMSASSQHNQ